MSSPRLFVRAPEQVWVHPRILTISPSKGDRLFAPRRRVLICNSGALSLYGYSCFV
jgi:hypothetical protein